MGKELYVGHLSYDTSEYDLEKLFSVSGRVTSIHLITDPATGRFMGCGYVRMSSEKEAKDAIASLDGALLIGSVITVSEARPQKQQGPGKGGYKGKFPSAPRTGPGAKPGGTRTGMAGQGASKPGKTGSAKPAPAKTSSPNAASPKAGGPKAGSPKAASPKTGAAAAGRPKTGKR